MWNRVNYAVGLPSAVLAAVAGTLVLRHHAELGGYLALGAAVLAALTTFLDPSSIAHIHQRTATRYGALDGKLRRLAEIDVHLQGDPAVLRKALTSIVAELDSVDGGSPALPTRSRRKYGLDQGQRRAHHWWESAWNRLFHRKQDVAAHDLPSAPTA